MANIQVPKTIDMESGLSKLKTALLYILIGITVALIIWGIVSLISYTSQLRKSISSKDNNASILNERITQLGPEYDQRKDKIRDYTTAYKDMPTNNRALINFHILTTNVAGYMGPPTNGIFSGRESVRRAFDMGVRHFILPIDYLDKSPDTPVLVIRDDAGILRSNNLGQIDSVINELAEVRKLSYDPIIITLYFHRLPGTGATSKEALNFMSRVSKTLKVFGSANMSSGNTTEGDYSRQGMADELMLKNIDTFAGKILIFTNVDTMGFRRPDVKYRPDEDLDIHIHLRLKKEAINTFFYYIQIPKVDEPKISDTTRQLFTIAMNKSFIDLPTVSEVQKTAGMGIQSIAYDVIADIADNKSTLSTALGFTNCGFVAKKDGLRYVPQAPVIAKTPSAAMNANGGILSI